MEVGGGPLPLPGFRGAWVQGDKNLPKDSPAVSTEAVEAERARQKDSQLGGKLGAPSTTSTPPIPF